MKKPKPLQGLGNGLRVCVVKMIYAGILFKNIGG